MDKRSQLESYEKNMDTLFKELFEKFENSDFKKKDNLPPCKGIYVFYLNGTAIYVGRTNNIKNRIKTHTQRGSGSEKASFAFNLAKKKYSLTNDAKLWRKDLMKIEEFKKDFEMHKESLADAEFKFIEIENDILQTMFEPYLAYKLKTYPHNNTFENH
ncbi:MAG: GIY-YIG nuclease family protein [Flavobacterium sp.]|nr:GIY-YIG nuclease family protein [Flavobacterium sp.]